MPLDQLYVQQDTDCLYTTLQNISGKERVFGYLGERGKRLAVGEMVTIPGNLINQLGGGGKWSQRRFKALERSLLAESIAIVNTPGVHVYDPINDVTRVLSQEGGVVGSVDPCWTKQSLSSSSSAP
jgi:hypothetical protein